jgi:hypothetical protein
MLIVFNTSSQNDKQGSEIKMENYKNFKSKHITSPIMLYAILWYKEPFKSTHMTV